VSSIKSGENAVRLTYRIFLLSAVFLFTAGAPGAVYGEGAFSLAPATPAHLLFSMPGRNDTLSAPRCSRPEFLSIAPDKAEDSLAQHAEHHATDLCVRSERRFPMAFSNPQKKKNPGTHDSVLNSRAFSIAAALCGQKSPTLSAYPPAVGLNRGIRLGEPRASPSTRSPR
jgi:hypothetical protein